ncbi:hypothetical protein ANAPC5_01203 [Anaplasma phagocytophilum]|nr:hypothetical protein ANAPC5_01203 [Anaplasma phagocytophilum]
MYVCMYVCIIIIVCYKHLRGLRTKADELVPNIVTMKFDVFCLMETWLCNEIPYSSYFTPNYKDYHSHLDYQSTAQEFGGRVLMATDTYISSHRRFDLDHILSSSG